MCSNALAPLDPGGMSATLASGGDIDKGYTSLYDPLGLSKGAEDLTPPVFGASANVEKAPGVSAAAEAARRRELNSKGRQSTILTGGQGVTDNAPLKRNSLLGV